MAWGYDVLGDLDICLAANHDAIEAARRVNSKGE